MKLYRVVDCSYDGRDAQAVELSHDGGKSWKFWEYYHLAPRGLQNLQRDGYEESPCVSPEQDIRDWESVEQQELRNTTD